MRLAKVCLLAGSLAISIGLFALADRLYSDRFLKWHAKLPVCEILHPTRHHAFARSSHEYIAWGDANFHIYTNNLGLRDEQTRVVPLRVDRPRLLFVGDSFTVGHAPWDKTYVGRFANAMPQFDILNAGMGSYSPSNYFLITRELLNEGVHLDGVLILIDISDVQDEAACYIDNGPYSVTLRGTVDHHYTRYERFREALRSKWLLTNRFYRLMEKGLVTLGIPIPLMSYGAGEVFDFPRGAWTYRGDLDKHGFPDGYAPVGVEGGINREKAKMDLLYQMLHARGIPMRVAVYPWPQQLAHNDLDSRQVHVWQDWCKEKGCRFINLFPDFFREKKERSRVFAGAWYPALFIFGDAHYNEYGNEVVARRLVEEYRNVPVKRVP